MSRVEELITQLCPNGIAFTELRNVCQIKNGKDWKTQEQGDIPVYGSGGRMEATVLSPSYNKPTVLLPRKGSLNVQYVEEPFWNVDTVFYTICDAEVVEPKFLFYYLKTINLAAISTSSTRPSLTQTALSKIRVPLPPLPVQREIVRTLDTFTQLEAELEAELEARRGQYDYYRNALFADIDTSGEWQRLGLHGVFQRGSALQKKHLTDKGKPCFHYGEVYTHYGISAYETKSFVTEEFSRGKRVLQPGDLFIATTSENEEDLGKAVAWLGKTPAVASSDALIYRTDLDPRYVSHYFSSIHFNRQKLRYITGTKVKRLSDRALAQISIPVPELEKQREVASKLDKFDAIVNDLSSGLPAEIAARRKQYEYYRDKLLAFKELSV